jgi:hypothetical protein
MHDAKFATTAKGEKALLEAAESKKTEEFSTPSPTLVNMATIEDDDERLLARIGYKQASSRNKRLAVAFLTSGRN